MWLACYQTGIETMSVLLDGVAPIFIRSAGAARFPYRIFRHNALAQTTHTYRRQTLMHISRPTESWHHRSRRRSVASCPHVRAAQHACVCVRVCVHRFGRTSSATNTAHILNRKKNTLRSHEYRNVHMDRYSIDGNRNIRERIASHMQDMIEAMRDAISAQRIC